MYAVQTVGMKERLSTTRIDRIECFRFDREAARLLVPSCGSADCCGILKISTADGESGVGRFHEHVLNGDFIHWACAFQRIKHFTLADGLHEALVKQEAWGDARTVAVMVAIHELARRFDAEAGVTWLDGCFRESSYCFQHAEAYVIF